jgi:hypothetical protein
MQCSIIMCVCVLCNSALRLTQSTHEGVTLTCYSLHVCSVLSIKINVFFIILNDKWVVAGGLGGTDEASTQRKGQRGGRHNNKKDNDIMYSEAETNSFMQEIQSIWFSGVCKKWKATFGFVRGNGAII